MSKLSLGTVVIVNGISKQVMIYAYDVINTNNNEHYDYLGCFYPDGYLGDDYNIFFNKGDILEIKYKLKEVSL